MNIVNIEVKSSVENPEEICLLLSDKNARFKGEDNQIDTYFKIESGRLKIRQGNIENYLIHYFRPESKNIKRSAVRLQELPLASDGLLQMLTLIHGVLVTVKKSRKIFYIENVKFHVDRVEELGHFIEIEACDQEGKFSESYLRSQCDFYIRYLGLKKENFIDLSYSDMLMSKLKARSNKLELAM
jgi:adenylate cyclase, class 2